MTKSISVEDTITFLNSNKSKFRFPADNFIDDVVRLCNFTDSRAVSLFESVRRPFRSSTELPEG